MVDARSIFILLTDCPNGRCRHWIALSEQDYGIPFNFYEFFFRLLLLFGHGEKSSFYGYGANFIAIRYDLAIVSDAIYQKERKCVVAFLCSSKVNVRTHKCSVFVSGTQNSLSNIMLWMMVLIKSDFQIDFSPFCLLLCLSKVTEKTGCSA